MARLPAKLDAAGDLSALGEQDRSPWNAERVAEGLALLERSARGDEVTTYYLEAAIAAEHASAPTFAATDWRLIVSLYDKLIAITPSWLRARGSRTLHTFPWGKPAPCVDDDH